MTLQVTEQATGKLKDLLENTEHEPDQVIRLQADPVGNSGFALDIEREGDQIITHDGDTVMVVDSEVSEKLEGATLDAKETPEGVSFQLR